MNTNSFGSKFSHKAPIVNIARFSSSKNKLHKKISEKKVKKMSQLLVPTTKMVAVVTKKSFHSECSCCKRNIPRNFSMN